MSEIIQLAERLGKAIAGSLQAAALRTARAEMKKDTAAGDLLKQFREQADKIAGLEQDDKPVEVTDKHRLRELQQKLAASPTFKKYTAAQVEYIDLMRKVNATLDKQLSETEPE